MAFFGQSGQWGGMPPQGYPMQPGMQPGMMGGMPPQGYPMQPGMMPPQGYPPQQEAGMMPPQMGGMMPPAGFPQPGQGYRGVPSGYQQGPPPPGYENYRGGRDTSADNTPKGRKGHIMNKATGLALCTDHFSEANGATLLWQFADPTLAAQQFTYDDHTGIVWSSGGLMLGHKLSNKTGERMVLCNDKCNFTTEWCFESGFMRERACAAYIVGNAVRAGTPAITVTRPKAGERPDPSTQVCFE
eukprot:TRINITY_DN2170_c0_g1_i1.p1 TRINITY_DN2170_c0_g1~~TRINITY_DN2170_c0_g1_i1.p1  ORF type:complete len:243 (-),score=55.44 TRINITY_DN2170_c0_g1_i1:168-896(-)